jgi:hypothetical protein
MLWTGRLIGVVCLLWLVTFGPASLLLPRPIGFKSVNGSFPNIYFESSMPAEFVNLARAHVETACARACKFWGAPPDKGGIRVFLCGSRSRYKQLSLGAGGNAAAAGATILLYPEGIGRENLEAIISHEMSHAFLSQHVGYLRRFLVPVWLDEGIATFLGTPTWASAQALEKNLSKMAVPQLVSASQLASPVSWGSAVERAGTVFIAYGYARSLVEYLINEEGQEKVRAYAIDESHWTASSDLFARKLGVEMHELETRWLAQAKIKDQVPEATVFVSNHLRIVAVLRCAAPYAFIALCILWALRQCGRLSRFLWRLKRRRQTITNAGQLL